MPYSVASSLALVALLAPLAPTAEAQDPAAMMARIEAPQVPNRGALDGLHSAGKGGTSCTAALTGGSLQPGGAPEKGVWRCCHDKRRQRHRGH